MVYSWLSGNVRRALVAFIDIGLATISLGLAFLLRGNFTLRDVSAGALVEAMLFAAVAGGLAFALTGTNLALWRYVTVRDFGTLMAGATAAVLGFLALMFLWNRLETVPRAVPVIQWLVLVMGLCGSRIGYAGLVALLSRHAKPAADSAWQPVLLVGGGSGAALVARLLQMAPQAGWRPVGILDDRLTIGRMLDNVPILGGLGDFRRVVAGLALRGMRPSQIVITGPHDEIGLEAVRQLQKRPMPSAWPSPTFPTCCASAQWRHPHHRTSGNASRPRSAVSSTAPIGPSSGWPTSRSRAACSRSRRRCWPWSRSRCGPASGRRYCSIRSAAGAAASRS